MRGNLTKQISQQSPACEAHSPTLINYIQVRHSLLNAVARITIFQPIHELWVMFNIMKPLCDKSSSLKIRQAGPIQILPDYPWLPPALEVEVIKMVLSVCLCVHVRTLSRLTRFTYGLEEIPKVPKIPDNQRLTVRWKCQRLQAHWLHEIWGGPYYLWDNHLNGNDISFNCLVKYWQKWSGRDLFYKGQPTNAVPMNIITTAEQVQDPLQFYSNVNCHQFLLAKINLQTLIGFKHSKRRR